MTGRWTYMDASSTARSTTRVRAVCVTAALLCALGIITGAVVRTGGKAHHHHVSASAAVTVADGQGGLARGDQTAVLGTAPRATTLQLTAVATDENGESADQFALGVAQPRGPPTTAA